MIESGNTVALLCRRSNNNQDISIRNQNLYLSSKIFDKFYLPIPNNPFWKYSIRKTVSIFKPQIIIVREIFLAKDVSKIAKMFDIPLIMDMADNTPVLIRNMKMFNNFFTKLFINNFLKPELLEKESIEKMDGIITVCLEQSKRLNELYNYDSNKIHVCHNTPKKEWYNGVKTGILIKPNVFAYHGMLQNDRNIMNLLKAFNIAWKINNSIKLIIAGYGSMETEIRKNASELECTENIIFKGKFSHNQMKRLLSEMDFGILPYKINQHINQTLTNRYFDYMGAGKPMITSLAEPMIRLNVETSSGVAINCENCELLADTILQFVDENNFERLQEMSESAMHSFNCHYSWDRDSARLITFLKMYVN